MAVNVDECKRQNVEPTPDPSSFPEHAFIDFSNLSGSQIKKTAKLLKVAADLRGWLFKPDVDL